MNGAVGLTAVSTENLRRLMRAVYREELVCPHDRIGLAVVGLGHIADDVEVLRGLDNRAVLAVLTCTIAERTKFSGKATAG